jgi:hypothetical protein
MQVPQSQSSQPVTSGATETSSRALVGTTVAGYKLPTIILGIPHSFCSCSICLRGVSLFALVTTECHYHDSPRPDCFIEHTLNSIIYASPPFGSTNA